MAAAAEECRRKVVVDEVSGWLRILADGSVDRTWTGMPEAGFLMTPVAPFLSPRDGVTLHDLPGGSPSLRIYLPEGAQQARAEKIPVFLHFHGGGFCISHCSWFMYYQFYARLAASLPAVVVSVELPLAPEHRLPAAIDVGYEALLRLRDLARGSAAGPADALLLSAADFSRVFLIGDSSGGNLVHQVAARALAETPEFWAPLRVAGGVPIHPGFVRSTRSRSESEHQSDSVFFTLDMLDKFLKMGLPEGATKDHPYTCPMGDAAPPLDKVALPPFLVAVAEKDLIRDTNLEYCEAMKKAGKEVEVVVSREVSHSFYLNKFAVDNDPITGQRTHELLLAINHFVSRH